MTQTDWTEITIFTTTAGVEPLTGNLLTLGISGFVIEDPADFRAFAEETSPHWDYLDESLTALGNPGRETIVKAYLPCNAQGFETLALVRERIACLREFDTGGEFGRLEISLSGVREEDWANNWKQYFKPFPVGDRLYIKPTWEPASGAGERIVLEIDPASSFGTGSHHTTQLCLCALERAVTPGCTVLDIGCGSGILGIAAMLLGAGHVTAVDIDENSVRIAGENYLQNRIDPAGYSLLCGNLLTDPALLERICSKPAEVLVANIVADVLIAMREAFARLVLPGGVLIVSGILAERAGEVCSALESAGFKIENSAQSGGWEAISLTRADS